MITAYTPDEHGVYQTHLPEKGPCRDHRDCLLCPKDRRLRKTGPKIELLVVHCRVHRCCFTLYPPGHVPYGRVPLVLLTLDGRRVERDRGPPYQGTLFQAARDAKDGRFWPRESEEGSRQARRTTQARQLERVGLILGLWCLSAGNSSDRVMDILGIAGMSWVEARRRVESKEGYRGKGQGVWLIIKPLPESFKSFIQLSTLGYHAGFWPKPQALVGLFRG